jgi:hypothetical protein
MFSNIDPADTHAAYTQVDAAIHSVRGGRYGTRVSLCETASRTVDYGLRLSPQEDLHWLDMWINSLPENSPVDPELWHQMASLFLLRAILANWRAGSPGEVWPLSFRGIRPEILRYLSVARGSGPSKALCNALQGAITRLNLRHMLDSTDLGIQQWYRTITLQFGIRVSSFSRLPFLLGTVSPEANVQENWVIHHLREVSRSFSLLRLALVRVRKKELSLDEARAILVDSNWIWPGMVDHLLAHAVSKPEIPVWDDHEFVPDHRDLLEQPWLEWNQGNPCFYTSLKHVPSETAFMLGWIDPTLSIAIGGMQAGRMVRNLDGSYKALNTGALSPKTAGSAFTVSVSNRQGKVLLATTGELFLEDREFCPFVEGRTKGRFLPFPEPVAGREMMIRTPTGWAVMASMGNVTRSRAGNWDFWHVPAEAGSLSILDNEGFVSWDNRTDVMDQPVVIVPELAVLNPETGIGHVPHLRLGEAFIPMVHNLRAETALVSAEWGGNAHGGLNPGAALRLSPGKMRNGMRFTCRLDRLGRRQRIQIWPYMHNNLHLSGVIEGTSAGWEQVEPALSRNASTLGNRVFEVAVFRPCPGTGERNYPPKILEGTKVRGTLGNRGATLPLMDGLGEMVYARSVDDSSEMIFHSTYRGGIVNSAVISYKKITLHLSQPIPELDPEKHSMVTWSHKDGVRAILAGQLCVNKDGRQIEWYFGNGVRPVCAGLAFDGVVVGWGPVVGIPELLAEFTRSLGEGDGPLGTRELVAMAAAFPFPVLCSDLPDMHGNTGELLDELCQAASRNGGEVLLGWKKGSANLAGLRVDSTGPASRRWMDVTATLLCYWDPAAEGNGAQDALMEAFFPDIELINDCGVWARIARWNCRAFAFLLDSLPLGKSGPARRNWGSALIGCLGDEAKGMVEPHTLIRSWANDGALRQMAEFLDQAEKYGG